jgi:membrane protein CcdC involved in cytochrome C biogenesis
MNVKRRAVSAPVKIRRMDALPFILIGILVVGSVGAPLYNHDLPVEGTALFYAVALAIAVMAYVDGPAAYLAVGPSHVVIGNWIWRYVVPRSRITDVGSLEYLNLYLLLDDGRKIRLRVFDPAVVASTSRSPRHGARRARAITEAITNSPIEEDGSQAVIRRLRWFNVVLIGLPFAAVAAILVAGSFLGAN